MCRLSHFFLSCHELTYIYHKTSCIIIIMDTPTTTTTMKTENREIRNYLSCFPFKSLKYIYMHYARWAADTHTHWLCQQPTRLLIAVFWYNNIRFNKPYITYLHNTASIFYARACCELWQDLFIMVIYFKLETWIPNSVKPNITATSVATATTIIKPTWGHFWVTRKNNKL